jgi:probable DNA metabolism protein
VNVPPLPAYVRWRAQARANLEREVAPEDAKWIDDAAPGLFDHAAPVPNASTRAAAKRVPPRLVELFEHVACHRDPRRFALMYRVLWRSLHGEPRLIDDAADDDIVTLVRMHKAVNRSRHKMTAFVRFREVSTAGGERYIAWFVPEHDVLRLAAPFFAQRFGTMHWTIATPDGIAHWNRRELSIDAPDAAIVPPEDDATEALWIAYYEAIFNPARLNVKAMRREMPQRYWSDLPEAARIPALIVAASERAGRMAETTLERDVAPYRGMQCAGGEAKVKDASKAALDRCRRCELGTAATQAVGGAGPSDARIVIVGEQPGDEEDLAGRPFVGPAGRVLKAALTEAGIDASRVFLTNAVKHFRFEPRGKRRIHKTPAQRHVEACRQWLEGELASLDPAVIVMLGATAVFAVTGQKSSVADARTAEFETGQGPRLVASYHPSAILRAPDESAREALRAALVADLRRAREITGD